MLRRILRGFGALALLCATGLLSTLALPGELSSAASAQSAAAPAEDRAQSFQAVSGAVQEDVAGGPLLLAAYAFVWLAVFGYVLRLGRLHGRIEDNLNRLQAAVGQSGGPTQPDE